MRGAFAVIVKRTPDGWFRVTGLYQGRPWPSGRPRIARGCAGHCRHRDSAIDSVRAVVGRMEG